MRTLDYRLYMRACVTSLTAIGDHKRILAAIRACPYFLRVDLFLSNPCCSAFYQLLKQLSNLNELLKFFGGNYVGDFCVEMTSLKLGDESKYFDEFRGSELAGKLEIRMGYLISQFDRMPDFHLVRICER